MSRFQFKAAGQQSRPPRPEVYSLLNAWTVGLYGAYYDITEPLGALSIDNVEAKHTGDPVHTLTQLLSEGTGDDLHFMLAEGSTPYTTPGHLDYRRDIVCSTGNKLPRKPMLFYPKGYFTSGGSAVLKLPSGTLGVPEGEAILAYTTCICGVKMLHELNMSPEDQAALETSGIGLPVPLEPGTVTIRVSLQGEESPSLPVIEFFVNGSAIPLPPDLVFRDDPVDHAVGLDTSQFTMLFSMPCWATQKMFSITRALTDTEITDLHEAMMSTIEVYN